MPPKRNTSIGRKTSAARRVSVARSVESEEAREARLEADQARLSSTRANETSPQRQARLCDKRTRSATSRANETSPQRQARLEADRARLSSTRANETSPQRQARLGADRARLSSTRAQENERDLKNAAFNYNPAFEYQTHPNVIIGKMIVVCQHCSATKWKGEAPGMCCNNGKVMLPVLNPPPDPLKSLMSGTTPASRHFLDNIRRYNCCFQMTSFGAKEIREPGFMPTFKIQGQVYHRFGSLLPTSTENPQFLQIYFMGDPEVEAQMRCSIIPDLRQAIVHDLQGFLHRCHAYVGIFTTALEHMPNDDFKIRIRPDKTPHGEHQRRFNVPTYNEVAIVMVGNDFEPRDIVLRKRDNMLQRVADTHRSYDSLQYPLIFWQGEDGYYFGIPQTDPSTGQAVQSKKVSSQDFYAYRIMVRVGEENHILKCKMLFLQFIVDMYAKIESERLRYIRCHQQELRAENYIHLRDAMASESNPNELGKRVILPATVTGSPRHMHEYTQDAMTYVRKHGRPDLFITFTCNPVWPEIQENLFQGQSSSDRHDLIARVFKQKLTKMVNVITKSHIFGETRCWMYTIEWQKRGLPHAHMLFWLVEKIKSTEIDNVISAEIPDPQGDPLLHAIVTKNMIHGPCGHLNRSSPCMVDGKCSKKFPRDLISETQTGDDSYPLYRRRKPGDGGFTAKLKMKVGKGHQEVEVDNSWIVPFNPLLSKMFQAHINVEWCHSVRSIKYICKYINKGSDQAVFEVQGNQPIQDEVQAFQLGRYICSNEAVWRILNFSIHERYPTVMHLSVHLENGQRVYFRPETLQQQMQVPPRTTLVAFFELCQQDPFARTLLYCDVAHHYTWDVSHKQFHRRKQGRDVQGHPGVKATDALGRVYSVHPSNAECFYLRMLLHVVQGPTSFASLKTVGGVVCETYREACERRGMLENDSHWDMTIAEAVISQSPQRIRHLFAILLTTWAISNPKALWEKYKLAMTEDYLMHAQRENPNLRIDFCDAIYNKGLTELENLCLSMAGKALASLGMPSPPLDPNNGNLCAEVFRQTNYQTDQLQKYVSEKEPLLTADQRSAYQTILQQVEGNNGSILFLDAPGGTGKTFVINLLLAKIRLQKKIALAVASSGIAATLLEGGRTAHSALKLPLNLAHGDAPVCDISKGTGHAKVLQQCFIIVWDECTMAHKRALEALHLTMQDLRNNKSLMGGVTVLLAGDFRQTLPVIPRSTGADELNACLKASYLWRSVRTLKLTTNMRVRLSGDQLVGVFSNQLLALGNGQATVDAQTGLIKFPANFCTLVNSAEELIVKVFPNIQQSFARHDWICERAILAPKNESVAKINLQIQRMLPGNGKSYHSIDTVTDPNEAVNYPIEFLNSLEPSGCPPHILHLKIGTPIILLRNLDSPKLCNGTRLIIKALLSNLIEATILTGCGKGENVFIPRIPIIPNDLPFSFRRLQFPIRLAFAMTINKAQGQSLKVAGINLEQPCFSHGQLYVACSRVGSPRNLFILTHDGTTKNIVYQKALQ